MSKPRTSTLRTAECADVVALLRGQGLDQHGPSLSEHEPERENENEGEMLVVAVHCGPCVGLYRAGRPARRSALEVTHEEASTS
jgi:hypothetical protein